MAKKNDDYQDEYQEVLKGLFDLIKEHAKDATPEQLQQMDDILSGKITHDDMLNDMYFRYQRPDYKQLGSTEITWLGPFFNAKHDDNRVSLCGWLSPKTCKSKKDYEERLKTGKIQKINDGTIADRLFDWEDENL